MLKFDRSELIPAVIQDATTGDILMVAFMNEDAFKRTRETGYTHFFSRSRQAIWRKGEQSGNVQEVCAIFVNCEENSLLIRVVQHGGAACHTGHRSCYYRRLLPDDTYETVTERIFDPAIVYGHGETQPITSTIGEDIGSPYMIPLETNMRQLYNIYRYLFDHNLSEKSNTSRLLLERNQEYLTTRLANELKELTGVQSGEHVHTGQQPDTILEGSQVAYWLMLIATINHLRYEDVMPHISILQGYTEDIATKHVQSGEKAIEQQKCLKWLATNDHTHIIQGLHIGFMLIGWACAQADVNPLSPSEYDLEQMRRKGLIQP